jgi:lipopolysaccharide transport system ATP-binding protein
MMGSIALEMDHVYKKFQKGERFDTLRDLVPSLVRRTVRVPGQRRLPLSEREFWALRDISFTVERGEAVAFIGHNGAGKSTLLKLLSGVMQPTSGRLQANGRLSALIDVGAGFHPDLTGRENVFLNGVILGMSRRAIAEKFDSIVEFAGLGEFIDTPVKRYSSGMFARLGFSVAAHVDPEILIVDEVLSVGDHAFQRRCMAKMHEILQRGTTVLFVSHNLHAVVELCPRCVMLSKGQVIVDGPTERVVATYTQAVEGQMDRVRGPVSITSLVAAGPDGEGSHFESGDSIRMTVELVAHEAVRCDSVGILIRDLEGRALFSTSTLRLGRDSYHLEPGQRLRCEFAVDLNLGQGEYSVGVQAGNRDMPHDTVYQALTLYVSQHSGTWQGLAACNPRFVGDEIDAVGSESLQPEPAAARE